MSDISNIVDLTKFKNKKQEQEDKELDKFISDVNEYISFLFSISEDVESNKVKFHEEWSKDYA